MGQKVRDQILVGARLYAPLQTGPGAYQASHKMSKVSLSRGQSSPGVALTTHPHLAPRLKKDKNYNSTPLLAHHVLFCGELYLLSEIRG